MLWARQRLTFTVLVPHFSVGQTYRVTLRYFSVVVASAAVVLLMLYSQHLFGTKSESNPCFTSNAPLKLCNGTWEHGIFNLDSLSWMMDTGQYCSSTCLFIPPPLVTTPTSSVGWAFSPPGQCWKEISWLDSCIQSYPYPEPNPKYALDDARRKFSSIKEDEEEWLLAPYAAEEGAEQGAGVPATSRMTDIETSQPAGRTADSSPPCDLILSPEEHPPHGFCGPKVLIIGAMKCGTNKLGSLLSRHPDVQLKVVPDDGSLLGQKDQEGNIFEIHYLTHKTLFENQANPSSLDARRLYAQHLPETDGENNMTFDKSPSYLDTQYHGGVASVAKKLLPNARIVATVCNPVQRVWSQYQHYLANNLSSILPNSFDELVDIMLSPYPPKGDPRLQMEFFEVGLYAVHLADWIAEYGRDRVLVVLIEDVEQHPEAIAERLILHAGLSMSRYPPLNEVEAKKRVFANNKKSYQRDKVPEWARRRLQDAYAPTVVWLADILGDERVYSWVSEE